MTIIQAKAELDVRLSIDQLHQVQRQNLWASAWTSVASANDCKKSATATSWADDALAAFDLRFRQPSRF